MKPFILVFLLICSHGVTAASLSDLCFMQGQWHSEGFAGGDAVEVWQAPKGNTMIGSFHGEMGNGRIITEFMLIEASEDQIVMRWNHYNTDYSRWEAEPIEHVLKSVGENTANFEMKSAVKGLPMNLIYRREGDQLSVWVGDESAEDQKGAFELVFKMLRSES